MSKFRIILPLLVTALMVTAGYCQEKLENHQTKTISGTVTETDYVGSTINVQTDEGQMAFFVPGDAKVVRETHDIGLMDIKQGRPVTIQYYTSSPGKNVVVSIVDNKPVVQ